MAISKEEFEEGMRHMAADASDEYGDFARLREDFVVIKDDLAPHDAELATCVNEVISALDRMAQHIITRSAS